MPAKKTSKKPQNATPKLIVHMVRTENVAIELMESIHDRISMVLGPISYRYDAGRNVVESGAEQLMSWDAIFALCEAFRTKHQIPADEVVELFIDKPNECNWFAGWDRSAKLNFFIHTKGYEHIIDADPEYPLVYELATVPMLIQAFDNLEQAENYAHEESRGCVFDYTRNKKEAMLRLRTADLCPECIQLFENRKADAVALRQSLTILELIRSQMLYIERSNLLKEIPSLIVDKNERTLRWNGAPMKCKLAPLEMTIYRLFLENEQGIALKKINNFKNRLIELYGNHYSNNDLNKEKDPINSLVLYKNPLDSNISKINSKIEKMIGRQICKNYQIIKQPDGLCKISIDRAKVKDSHDIQSI